MTNHWIKTREPDYDPYYTCSACEYVMVFSEGSPVENEFNYCPKCGEKLLHHRLDKRE